MMAGSGELLRLFLAAEVCCDGMRLEGKDYDYGIHDIYRHGFCFPKDILGSSWEWAYGIAGSILELG